MGDRIDLERARRDAKALLRSARAGAVVLRSDREPSLADAQRAVAVSLGFASWPALVAGVRGAELLSAAASGRASDVYRLLMDGAPANARDGAGRTALHLAAAGGFADVVDVLVGWVPVDRGAVDSAGRLPSSDDPVVARMLAPAEPPASDGELAELAWGADVALFSLLASSRLAARRAVGDGFAFRTGLFDNTRNGVVCSRVADVSAAIGFVRGAPASWLVGPDSDLGPALERAGCRAERDGAFMARAIAPDIAAGGDGIAPGDLVRDDARGVVIAPIADAPSLAAAMQAVESLDDVDGEIALLASLGFGRAMRHFAALLDGAPVGIASTFAWGETITLTQLAVAPAWRRRGIGRALVQHVSHGLTLLAPTPATIPFYAALGFRLLRYPRDRLFYLPV